MKRILLLGKNGQLGWEFQRTLFTLGQVTVVDQEEIDLRQPQQLRNLISQLRPHLIVNASAYTDVDRAENQPEVAMAVNAEAPGILAEEARRLGALLIHFSTDYVFDGKLGRPYQETDIPNPLNVYGRSKLLGEQAIQSMGECYFIFRTSWVYSTRGNGFVTKVLRWAREKDTLKIVDDQAGNPTWARMLAEITTQLIIQADVRGRDWQKEFHGVYHLAGTGFVTRLEWAQAILSFDPLANEQRCKALLPSKSSEFPTPAQRPSFSALNCELFTSTFGLLIPPWDDNLRLAMDASVFK